MVTLHLSSLVRCAVVVKYFQTHFIDGSLSSYSEKPLLKFVTNILESSIGFSAGGSANVEIILW
jgi:hypothetical protein